MLNAEWKLVVIQSSTGHPMLALQARLNIPDLRIDDMCYFDISILPMGSTADQIRWLNEEYEANRQARGG